MDKISLVEAIAELKFRKSGRRIDTFYPETGPLSRYNYPKHMSFFSAGAKAKERMMLSANRVGKTEGVGGYELVLHLTGNYPPWWVGKRFNRPVKAWAAGDTAQTVRDILQAKILGPIHMLGTGLVPRDAIVLPVHRRKGVDDAISRAVIKHSSGGYSELVLKSYEQGQKAFMGTEVDVVLLDEEPDIRIYAECVIRTMTTNGILMLTFTPLLGMSEVILSFMEQSNKDDDSKTVNLNLEGWVSDTKFVVQAGWDDAPHLTEAMKQEVLASVPSYQIDARTKGIPMVGAGAVYTWPVSDLIVQPFDIPNSWVRGYGFDVGWNRTAAIWGAIDPNTDVLYLYSEHYQGRQEPALHAAAILGRGDIPGFIDPASRGRSQKDGSQLLNDYRQLGLSLVEANNNLEAGIHRVLTRAYTGRLKIFSTLVNWANEYRLYARDDKGHVIGKNDHLMDATRYLVMHKDSMRALFVPQYTMDLTPSYGIVKSSKREVTMMDYLKRSIH